MTTLRVRRASDDFARALAARIVHYLLLGLGGLLVLGGVLLGPLPGPLGVPLVVVGLMIILHNSFRARRRFVELQRAHPKIVFPIRRLLRREPEIVLVMWQQYLRLERLLLPKRYRFAVKTRRRHWKRKAA